MKSTVRRLARYVPPPVIIDRRERLRVCGGVLIGLLLTAAVTRLTLGGSSPLPALLGSMGASALLLFAMPSSPLAQPWPTLGGNIFSALVGVICARWLGVSAFSGAIAVCGAILVMFWMRCLHPPGGAVALTAVLGDPVIHAAGFDFVLFPIAINSLLLLTIAVIYNNATRHRYPHVPQLDHANKHGTADAPPRERLGFTPADLDEVLKQYNEVLDINRDDLETLFHQAEMQAYRRRFGEITCADIMSRDVVTVAHDTRLAEAWTLLRQHKVRALPVVDAARHVVGIISVVDFMKHANLDMHRSFSAKMRAFFGYFLRWRLQEPSMVGQIMTRTVLTAGTDVHVVHLVPMLSDAGLHHVPIVDGDKRLVGMVTQSDLIAALYRGGLQHMPRAA